MSKMLNIHNQFNQAEINNPIFKMGGEGHSFQKILVAAGAVVPESFLGREEDLRQIRKMLTEGQNTLLLINAEGGMGKTTLAAKYWKTYEDNYQYMAWLFCEKGILTALREQLPLPLGLINTLNTYPDEPYMQVQAIKNTMANLPKDCLLVLDNANDPAHIDGFLHMMIGLGWHVLITSRCSGVLSDVGVEYTIKSLPPDDARQLFRSNYHENTAHFDILLDRFLISIGYNTLCIDLFSKNLREGAPWGYTFEKFLEHLETQGLFLGDDSFEIRADYARQAVGETISISDRIIGAMYNLSLLTKDQTSFLTTFALLPAENHSPDVLRELLPSESSSELKRALDKLARMGWITTDIQSYRISPVVQKILLNRYSNQVWELWELLILKMKFFFEAEYLGPEKINIEFLERVFDRLWVHQNASQNVEKALDTAKKMKNICEKINFKNALIISSFMLGEVYLLVSNYVEALKNFANGIKVYEELDSNRPNRINLENSLATSYLKLGEVYLQLGNLEEAFIYFDKEINLLENISLSNKENLLFKNRMAISYSKLGNFSRDYLNDFDKSKKYFQRSEKLWMEIIHDSPEQKEFHKILSAVQRALEGLEKGPNAPPERAFTDS